MIYVKLMSYSNLEILKTPIKKLYSGARQIIQKFEHVWLRVWNMQNMIANSCSTHFYLRKYLILNFFPSWTQLCMIALPKNSIPPSQKIKDYGLTNNIDINRPCDRNALLRWTIFRWWLLFRKLVAAIDKWLGQRKVWNLSNLFLRSTIKLL